MIEDTRSDRRYIIKILKWTCIGLALRLIPMPFTMQGQDPFWFNYGPMVFVTEGIWDTYGYISANYPNYHLAQYGPVSFIILSIAHFIFIKLCGAASLVEILTLVPPMAFGDLATTDYVNAFANLDLFKNLFLLKSPYLIFDFSVAAILLKIAKTRKDGLTAYKLWMVNIVILHTCYMIGQIGLFTIFFSILALLFAIRKRPYLAVASLALGGGSKFFPYIWIMPACLLLGNNWKKRSALLCTGIGVGILPYVPYYLSSGGAVFGFFTACESYSYTGAIRWILLGIVALCYLLIAISAVKDADKPEPEKQLIFYFLTIGFLVYVANPIPFRHFMYITPFLALIARRDKRFTLFMGFIILILAFLRLTGIQPQLGLLAPLNAEFFMNLPTLRGFLDRFVNTHLVDQILSRVLLLSFFGAAYWSWRLKSVPQKAV